MAMKQNPLQISLILSEIFKKLNVKDQKSFRLVSKIWMDSTLGHWRGSSALIVITHGTYYDFGAFLRLVKKGNEQFYRIEEFPFRQFRIVGRFYVFKTNEEMRLQTPGEKTFYQLVGPEIEYLEFNECVFESVLVFEGLKWVLLNFGLGNLKELVFTKTRLQLPRKILTEPDFNAKSKIKYALPAAENLGTLRINGFYYYWAGGLFRPHKRYVDLKEVFDIVPNLKNLFLDKSDNQILIALALHAKACESEKRAKLESLILENIRHETKGYAALEKYVEVAKPPLKHIQIELPDRAEPINCQLNFHRILEGCANTLAYLKLKFSPSEEQPDFNWLTDLTGRAFPCLTHLHLVFCQSFRESFGKFDFEAFRGMPSLRSFICVEELEEVDEDDEEDGLIGLNETLSKEELLYKGSAPFMGTQISRNCIEEIEMNQMQDFHYCLSNKFGTESLQMIGGWMKNLKGLKLVLDEKTFEIIPEVFLSLEKLTLLRGSTVGEDTIQKARASRSFFITVEEAEIESESESSSEDSKSLADRNEEADRYRAEQKKIRAERAAAAPTRRSQRIKKS